MTDKQTDTPRTEAARKEFVRWKCSDHPSGLPALDGWEFAEELERELAAALKRCAELERAYLIAKSQL
jgi:hypothetical protein